MPDRSRQFDFLSEHGFTPAEQAEATANAAQGAIEHTINKAIMRHAFEGILEGHSEEGQSRRVSEARDTLAGHGYATHQIEHPVDENGETRPAAAHHHGDFTAHWEPGHGRMYVFHKSQDRTTADPIAGIEVGHLHKDADNIPAVNQKAFEDWHSKPENVANAMKALRE